jgi:hypothetical protein
VKLLAPDCQIRRFALHIPANLIAGNTILVERFLHGAPFLAPLLYTNVGLLGSIALLETTEQRPAP